MNQKYIQNFTLLLTCLMTVVFISSCYKAKVFPAQAGGNYVLGFRSSGTNSSDYLLSKDTISNESGSLSSTGNGIEQLGWCYYAKAGNTVFSFTDKAVAFGIDASGNLYEKGIFTYEAADCYGEGDEHTLVAIGAPWGGGTYNCEIMLIDADNIGIKKRKATPIYSMSANDTLNKWPTSLIVNDGKLYVSYYPLNGSTWETQETDTAFVTIFAYPSLDSLTTIKDTRTGPIGYYGAPSCMVKAENGDIYAISTASFAAGFTQVTKTSGILRIKNGAQQFDPSYYFDVETATGGGKLLSATYAGNGLLVGKMVPAGVDNINVLWAAFSIEQPVLKTVIIDVNNKTVTDVTGVPLHGGQYGTKELLENGKVYTGITSSTAGEARIYEIDPVTATAKKGAKIDGAEVPAIFKLN